MDFIFPFRLKNLNMSVHLGYILVEAAMLLHLFIRILNLFAMFAVAPPSGLLAHKVCFVFVWYIFVHGKADF